MAYLDAIGALSDPTRRKVFEAVADSERSVGEIAADLPISRPAVSQHLKVLKQAGLVRDRPAGNRRIYRLDPDGLRAVREYVDRFWDAALAGYSEAAHEEARRGGQKGI